MTSATAAAALLALAPLAAAQNEPAFAAEPRRLTSPDQFSRAGEAYFSPDNNWIIFQAVPHDDETGGQPRYSMYVAALERDDQGNPTGLGTPIRISNPGSANTCGWFHPTLPGVVLFGSTIDPPANPEDQPGYSRDTSRYTWEFPREMDIVTRTVRQIVERDVTNQTLRAQLLARPDLDDATPLWTRDGYDAEGSWSPDGRTVLYTWVNPDTGDGDLYIRDLAADRSYPLITEPGYDGGPFFSPDGTWICYRSDRNKDNLLQLFAAELDFDQRGIPVGVKREVQLTDNGHVNWAPYWARDGKALVYASSEAGHTNYEVFAIPFTPDADDDAPTRRVTTAPGFDGLPVFSQDGSLMMWTGQRTVTPGEPRSSQLFIAPLAPAFDTLTAAPAPAPSTAAPAATTNNATVPQALAQLSPDARRFHEHTTVLASDWMTGRLPGTRGIELAEEYITHRFKQAGLAPLFDNWSYRQPFAVARQDSDDPLNANNIGGILRGKGELADRFIVIGAHHDHLGHGHFGSRSGAGDIHEGADDNASGTTAVLMLARKLAHHYADLPDAASTRSIAFVTFTAEESGLFGSRFFTDAAVLPAHRIDLMINFDMIGRVTADRISVAGAASGDAIPGILAQAAEASTLNVITPEGLTPRSDHANFYRREVPVLFFTIDPAHNEYHTTEDEAWKLNPRAAALVVDLAADITKRTAVYPDAVEFNEIPGFNQAQQGPRLADIRVRFGVRPGNYSDNTPGVAIDGVSPNTSAANAGVRAGDRLVQWNDQPVPDINRWLELLAQHDPGDVVNVTVIRDGERVTLPVTLLANDG